MGEGKRVGKAQNVSIEVTEKVILQHYTCLSLVLLPQPLLTTHL